MWILWGIEFCHSALTSPIAVNTGLALQCRPSSVKYNDFLLDCCNCGMCMLKFVCLCAVCSKTLWIGRLNKHTTEQELSSELSQFGKISSINVSYA